MICLNIKYLHRGALLPRSGFVQQTVYLKAVYNNPDNRRLSKETASAYLLAKRYFVELEPDFSRGLDVVLVLNRGIEGNLDGLNPKIFKKLE